MSLAGPSSNTALDLVTSLLAPAHARSTKRRAREIATAAEAALHYTQRVQERRLTLANPDRARPAPESGTLAERQVRRRDARVTKRALGVLRRRERGAGKEKEGKRRKVERGSSTKKGEKVGLSRRERRELGLEVVDEQPTYASMLPLYALWSDYVCALLGLSHAKGAPSHHLTRVQEPNGAQRWSVAPNAVPGMQAALAKADFCGAWVTVTKAANPSLVGLSGIVLRETEQTFVIVPPPPPSAPAAAAEGVAAEAPHEQRRTGQERTVRVIPKHALQLRLSIPLPVPTPSAAAMQLDTPSSTGARQTLDFTLYAEQLRYLAANRAARKFKARKTIDI